MLSQQERCIHHQTSPSVVWCAGAIQFWMVFVVLKDLSSINLHEYYRCCQQLYRSRWWFQPFVTIMSLCIFVSTFLEYSHVDRYFCILTFSKRNLEKGDSQTLLFFRSLAKHVPKTCAAPQLTRSWFFNVQITTLHAHDESAWIVPRPHTHTHTQRLQDSKHQ